MIWKNFASINSENFDLNFRLKVHVPTQVQNAAPNFKMLCLNKYLPFITLKKQLADSFDLCDSNLCVVVNGSFLDKSDINKIQVVQKFCHRCIYGIKRREHVPHKLRDANCMLMMKRRLLVPYYS